MKLLDLYRSILKTAHLIVDAEGFVSQVRGANKEPFLVDGQRLVLPTDEQMRAGEADTVAFHVLFEYLTRGESPVLAAYRRAVAERLHLSYLAFAGQLMTVASSQQMHAQLSPEQAEFLTCVPDADKQMFETFEKLCKAMPEGQNQKSFVSIYMKKGGMLHGKSCHRAAIVSFPLYQQLVKDGQERELLMEQRKAKKKQEDKKKKGEEKDDPIPNETYGVGLRAVDRESFIRLFEYMVPGIAEQDAYSAASNSQIAPTTDALMHAVEKLAAPINDLVDRYEDHLSDAAKTILKVEDNWVPDFVNLAPLLVEIRKIPMQAGNEGTAASVAAHVDLNAAEAEAQSAAGATPPQRVEPEEKEELTNTGGFRLPPKREQPRDYAALPIQQPPATIPGYLPPGQIPPGYLPPSYPPVQTPPPHYHQPQQQGQGGRGVDFQTLLQTNPQVRHAVQSQMPQQQFQQPQEQQPTWARNPGYHQQQPQYPNDPYQNQPFDPYRARF
jgi:hypothetical protein